MEELEKKLAELEAQLVQLLEENKQFKNREHHALQKAYDEMVEVISLAVEQGDKLEADYKNLQNSMDMDNLLIRLTEANNPNSDALGFKFTDVISNAVTNHFTKKITNGKVKEKFGEVVNRIVKNPVVAAILTTNPVTGMVYRVIDKITDFTTNNPLGMNLNKWHQETEGVFKEEKLAAFQSELTQYIDFYDGLIQASDLYKQSVEHLHQKNKSLNSVLENYYSDLLKDLGVVLSAGKSNLVQVQKILTPASPDELRGVMEKENVIAAHKKAQGFAGLKERYENLSVDYNNILISFFDAYLVAFQKAEKLGKDNFDPKKLSDLKMQIEKRKQALSKVA